MVILNPDHKQGKPGNPMNIEISHDNPVKITVNYIF